MCSKAMHLSGKCIDYKLNVLRGNSLNCLLDDMVAILILDTFKYVVFEFLD